jgi:hypothetical protein
MAAIRHPGQNDFQTPNLVAKPSEEHKERRADKKRQANHGVSEQQVDFERDRQEEERIELPCVPDDALAGSGSKERQQHIFVVGALEEGIDKRTARTLASSFIFDQIGDSLSFNRM